MTGPSIPIPDLQLISECLPRCLARGNQEILITTPQACWGTTISPFTHSVIPLVFLLGNEDAEMHMTHFLTLTISNLTGQISEKQTYISDTMQFIL